jgi:hypothetical protein
MESYIDGCLAQLVDALDEFARNEKNVNLKAYIQLYIFDVLGESAFSQSFGAIKSGDTSLLPPVKEHVRLAVVAGQIPDYTTQIIKLMAHAPIPWIKRLYHGRTALKDVIISLRADDS